MTDVAVIGAGSMGLAAAYHLLKAGHRVEVFEADAQPGGMAAHTDLDGLSIEQFYHFLCKADHPTFALMEELGLGDRIRWRPTSMSYFYGGRLHPWGTPVALLRFPHLDLLSKLRYGVHMFTATKQSSGDAIDHVRADDWVRRWGGERAWSVLWEKLFTLKFFEHSRDISAAWLWTRIKRVGTSRRNLMQEELGYIAGGSHTLVRGLVERIEAMGGRIHLSCPAEEIHVEGGAVTGVTAGGQRRLFGAVISTVPLPLIPGLIPGLPPELSNRYAALRNIGVVCVLQRLSRPVTDSFWVNINDEAIEVPGIVEYSNLNDELRARGEHIVYIPYYMPTTHPKFARDDDAFIAESFGYLQRLNPALTRADLRASRVGRLRHAQPVCPPGFRAMLPPVRTEIHGLMVADTSSYYPEDRGIAESVRLAREMAGYVA